jgi:hypothetical protein
MPRFRSLIPSLESIGPAERGYDAIMMLPFREQHTAGSVIPTGSPRESLVQIDTTILKAFRHEVVQPCT